jgi:hypothetical protein
MGYGFYFITDNATGEERPAGYYVEATCDKRGCDAEIDRGMGYCCGEPGSFETGCGRYFCGSHLGLPGPRGGCQHRQSQPWGKTLACMGYDPIRRLYCCRRSGHPGPCWVDET